MYTASRPFFLRWGDGRRLARLGHSQRDRGDTGDDRAAKAVGSARWSVIIIGLTNHFLRSRYDRFGGRNRTNTLAGIVGIAYLLAFALAVHDRIPISDWLASHLPL
jgi:hypothetical protein